MAARKAKEIVEETMKKTTAKKTTKTTKTAKAKKAEEVVEETTETEPEVIPDEPEMELAEPEDVPAEPEVPVDEVELNDDPDKQGTDELPKRQNVSTRNSFVKKRGHSVLGEEVVGEQGEGIQKTSKTKARKLYGTKNKVFTIDPDKPVHKSEGEKLHDTYIDLMAAMKTNSIREGVIEKITTVGENIVAAVVYYNGYQVIIPVSNLFVLNKNSIWDTDDPNAVQKYYASLRIGSNIKFIIRGGDEEKRIAYASRLLAMEKQSYEYFVEKQSNGKPQIVEGMDVEAVITYVTKTGVGVDVFGSEAFIPVGELQWLYTYDVTEENYEIGDVITVRVKSIKPVEIKIGDHNFRLIETEVSAKETQENPNITEYDAFKVGEYNRGVIVRVIEDGYIVRAKGRDEKKFRDIKCSFGTYKDPITGKRSDRILTTGSEVTVMITDKVDDGYKIFANLRRLIKENN